MNTQLVRYLTLIIINIFSYSLPLMAESTSLVQNECVQLNTKEVERLITLELSQTDVNWPYQINLTCQGDAVRIFTHGDSDQQVLERVIELNEADLKERIVALTVSQLVNTDNVAPAKPRSAPTPPEPISSPATAVPEEPGMDHVSFSIGGGIKPHDKFSLPTGYGLIRSDIWVRKEFGLISVFSFEGGRADRKLGSVTAMCGLVGLGVVWQPPALTSRFLHLELSSTASIGYTYLQGVPRPTKRGENVGGLASEFVIGLSGVVEAKGMFVALDALGGYTVDNPVGDVENEADVTLGGFWVGGGLRMGFIRR